MVRGSVARPPWRLLVIAVILVLLASGMAFPRAPLAAGALALRSFLPRDAPAPPGSTSPLSVHRANGPNPAAAPRTGPSGSTTILYGNRTVVLPDWNSLSAYAWSCNTNVTTSVGADCFSVGEVVLGRAGTQVPLLSWTADGVFYVNASFDLVFCSFTNGTVTRIAPWLPLYDDVMWYAGITNTEYLTTDGSYVYEFGCLVPDCRTNATIPVTSYAVNVSTGRTFEHNWSSEISATGGTLAYTTYYNAQMNMVGLEGNDSIETLTVTWGPLGTNARNGTVWAYNLWTRREWKLADLPFFEANNLYWVANYEQFFDVSADDTSVDAVAQLLLGGNPSQPNSTLIGPLSYSSGRYGIGGVGGLWVNLSSRTIAFVTDWQGSGGKYFAVTAQLSPSLRLAGFSSVEGPLAPGTTVAVTSGEHRSTLVSGGPAFSIPPTNASDEWLGDPEPGGAWLTANVSQSFAAWNVDGDLFYNTSYSILTASDQCNRVGNGTDCAILGTAPGTTPGTIWWSWRLGSPLYPFPSGAPLAEPDAPPPVAVVALATLGGYRLNWTPSLTDRDPILNYTVRWGPSGSNETNLDELPGNASGTLLPVSAGNARVFYEVDAWNLHWFTATRGNFSTAPGVAPSAPTISGAYVLNLSRAGSGTANVSIYEWEPGSSPAAVITNDTLTWGTSPGDYVHVLSAAALGLSVGTGHVQWTLPGVAAGRTYYLLAYAWDEWGESPPSNLVVLSIPSPFPPVSSAPGSSGSWVTVAIVAGALIAVPTLWAIVEIEKRRRGGRSPPRS